MYRVKKGYTQLELRVMPKGARVEGGGNDGFVGAEGDAGDVDKVHAGPRGGTVDLKST